MGRIDSTFAALKAQGRKAFIGYVMSGFPDKPASLALARGLLKEGADLLEIGLPFSDPIADGPVIQKAAEAALKQEGALEFGFEMAKALRAEAQAPLLFMCYLNVVLAPGAEAFAARAKAAGADGVIIPDLTPEESGALKKALEAQGLDLIFLAAPTSTPARLKKIAKAASGFIYMVSVAGVTGEKKSFDVRLDKTVAALRKETRLPLCVGFGVSSPETAKEAASKGEGVVVASTILKEFVEGRGMEAALSRAASMIQAAHSA